MDLIPKFKGEKLSQPVEAWIKTVNRCKEVYEWSLMHTFVAASKALDGVAKVWLANQLDIDTWPKLEAAMRREFEKKVSQSDIHRLMDKKRRKREQSTEQYFQEMRNLGRQGGLADDDVINYIINGIF